MPLFGLGFPLDVGLLNTIASRPMDINASVRKFCSTRRRALKRDWLGDLNTRPERVTVLPADQGAVEKFINAASRAAQGVAA